ncbi:hypothetical protein Landi51_09221 [Colletotrichum acutatum]
MQIAIPTALDGSQNSPYHFCFATAKAPGRIVIDALNILYAAGFVNVDEPDGSGYTPLFRRIKQHSSNDFGYSDRWTALTDLVAWFITRGAEIVNKNPEGWPNLMYYLALAYPIGIWDNGGSVNEHLKALSSAEKLHISTDGCDCFCSTAGCLPSRLAYEGWRVCGVFAPRLLDRWFNTWNMDSTSEEIISREECRRELFDRLEISHTCCCLSPDGSRLTRSDDEISQMRGEDAVLASQLDSLMENYDLAREAVGGPVAEFQDTWWRAVNQLLPLRRYETDYMDISDLDSVDELGYSQKPEKLKESERAEQEAEALRVLGYEGCEDFKDIIDDFFAKQTWSQAR